MTAIARWLFTLTIFVNAALLFLIQPMFARMILPLLGGSPAVWNTAMVCYQALLLAGYAYAHLSVGRLGARRQALAHLGLMLLPLIALPIAVPAGWAPPTDASPVLWLLALLLIGVGPPYAVVSAGSPLLQAWYAAGWGRAGSPYALYAASNLGSMVGLLGYPLLVEPWLPLAAQSALWSGGYVVLIALTSVCVALLWRAPPEQGVAPEARAAEPAPTWGRRGRWLLLSAAPSSLLLSVTSYLSNNIAAIPLLWVWPLALYLLTFTLVFATRPPLPGWLVARALPILLLPLLVTMLAGAQGPIVLLVPLHLVTFFLAALGCHGELAADRPGPARLTEFYLWLSLGGALGGTLNALVAPVVFDAVHEYPLALALCGYLVAAGVSARRGHVGSDERRQTTDDSEVGARLARVGTQGAETLEAGAQGARLPPWVIDIIMALGLGLLTVGALAAVDALGVSGAVGLAASLGLPALLCFSFSRRPLRFGLGLAALLGAGAFFPPGDPVVYAERTFFGVHRVVEDQTRGALVLVHGNTIHGLQRRDPTLRREPLSYYSRGGPLGQIFAMREGQPGLRVGAVGMGVATVACYAQPGQAWTFYEIDPAVVAIARDPALFTYLGDCLPDAPVVLGDARLALSQSDASYDLLILDAYSSDAIPVHLLTREAMALYLKRLAPGGALAFHLSNRHLDLEPVLAALAADAGLTALVRNHQALTPDEAAAGVSASIWAVVARTPADLGGLGAEEGWQPLEVPPGAPLWTDDFSSLVGVLRE